MAEVLKQIFHGFARRRVYANSTPLDPEIALAMPRLPAKERQTLLQFGSVPDLLVLEGGQPTAGTWTPGVTAPKSGRSIRGGGVQVEDYVERLCVHRSIAVDIRRPDTGAGKQGHRGRQNRRVIERQVILDLIIRSAKKTQHVIERPIFHHEDNQVF
jgi:hypothetical protein